MDKLRARTQEGSIEYKSEKIYNLTPPPQLSKKKKKKCFLFYHTYEPAYPTVNAAKLLVEL